MKTPQVAYKIRLILMSVTILAVAAFGIFGASWATPVRADGGTGTVPGSGGGGGSGGGSNSTDNSNSSSSNSNSSSNTGPNSPSRCGTGDQSFSLKAPADITGLLNMGAIGEARLLSNTGGVGNGAVRILFVPITSFTADLIAANVLQTSPAGWTDLGCGVQTSGRVSDGRAVTYIMKGQQVCFTLPVGAVAAYSSLRIAYYDTRLARWVFLTTKLSATQACHSSFRLAPTTFALFGSA